MLWSDDYVGDIVTILGIVVYFLLYLIFIMGRMFYKKDHKVLH